MSKTRYGHTGTGGGPQDKVERKDEDWTSRQGGDQSREHGRRGDERPSAPAPGRRPPPAQPQGTNTQGDLPGIGVASEAAARRLDEAQGPASEAGTGVRERDLRGAGTDQPPRMGGPLGADPRHPHLPEGEQDSQTKGTGARGFDVGVNAENVGAVHQGVRKEDEP
jgi:hypothetical protein